MLVTDQFVVLNFPKTGSSFVRATIKRIHDFNAWPKPMLRKLHIPHRSSLQEFILPVIINENHPYQLSPHGTYQQIPEKHKNKIIVSITRNPFDRYVSQYLFGWWKEEYLHAYPLYIYKKYPRFPDISFQDYYNMVHCVGRKSRLKDASPGIDLGMHTIQFIQFFFKDPYKTLCEIDAEYTQQKRYQADIPEIFFLHQEHLNQELHDFLIACDYPQEKINFILNAKKVNISRRSKHQQNLADFYTPDLIEQIRYRDKLLFKLFPEYDKAFP